MNNFFKIDDRLKALSYQTEEELSDLFKQIEETEFYNQSKVLNSFIKNKVSSSHFAETTGYGYGDSGKTIINKVFSKIFKAEKSLIRPHFVSGTHAISVALFGILKPNDTILSVTGEPYDTVKKVINSHIDKKNKNLANFNIKFKKVDLINGKDFNFELINQNLSNVNVVYVQRSKGYSNRSFITTSQIKQLVNFLKKQSKQILVLVDNCYGEFVEKTEPTEIGADLVCGSLIKNPGGGIATSGGYIIGKENLINYCANTLTAPGLGEDIGCNFNQNRNILMGIFMAPHIVANALKFANFARSIFKKLGLISKNTNLQEQQLDIISTINLKNKTNLLKFCEGIQQNSPIDSFVTPEPYSMPGYQDEIIMAAGTFTNGSSIELSADAPSKPPYDVFLQGSLTYSSGKICILNTIQKLIDEKLIDF